MIHASEVADALAAFVRRHPVDGAWWARPR